MYIDSFACFVAVTAFNIAGVIATSNAWSNILRRQTRPLLYLLPVIFCCAYLQSAFSIGGVTTGERVPLYLLGVGVLRDLLLWAVMTRAILYIRTLMSKGKLTASAFSGTLEQDATGSVDSELGSRVKDFLRHADKAEIAGVVATYDPAFSCVRVADEGGFVQLSREQMVDFWNRPGSHTVAPAEKQSAGVPTRETVVHFAEVIGDTGIALITRVKDLGNGWEPMFYCLVWKQRAGEWHLLREFVHQRTVPKWR